MKTFAMRVAVLTAVVSLSSLGYEANAGFRHLRMFRSSCAGPSCSGPSFGCSAPIYVAPPMMTSACSAPGCSMPMWGNTSSMSGNSSCFQPAWSGSSSVGSGPSIGFDQAFDAAPVYGATGAAGPYQTGGHFGMQGFGGAHTLPAYYAPMSAQYAPIPPAPAADIVW